MAEPSVPDQTAPSRRGGRLVAKARAHKLAATIIAVAGFLGLGGIFGQWAVDRMVELIKGDQPPAGFERLHARWSDTAHLSERLRKAGMEANKRLEGGVANIGGWTSPELLADLVGLRSIRVEAKALEARIRGTRTELPGARADLARLAMLVGDAADEVKTGINGAYARYRGAPITRGAGDPAPIASNELSDDVSAQDELVQQVSTGLGSTASRFDRPKPKIRGWFRLVNPEAWSDTPLL